MVLYLLYQMLLGSSLQQIQEMLLGRALQQIQEQHHDKLILLHANFNNILILKKQNASYVSSNNINKWIIVNRLQLNKQEIAINGKALETLARKLMRYTSSSASASSSSFPSS